YFECPVERCNRLLKGVECKKRPAHQVPGIGISGIDLQHLLVRFDGIVVPAKVVKDHSPVEPPQYRPGIGLDNVIECLNCRIEFSGCGKRDTFAVECLSVAGIEIDVFVEGRDCFIMSSQLSKSKSFVEINPRIILVD